MKSRITFAMLVLIACLAGCSKPAIVGEWEGNTSRTVHGMEAKAQVHASFKDDGKYALTSNIQMMGQSMTSQEEGTYKVKGDTITMTVSGVMLNGSPVGRNNAPITKTGTFQVKGDTLELKQDDKNQITLQRAK